MIINTSNKFTGDIFERNEQRIIFINEHKNELIERMDKLVEVIKNKDEYLFKEYVSNDIFFENIPDAVVIKYIERLSKVDDLKTKLSNTYSKYGHRGFTVVIGKALRT